MNADDIGLAVVNSLLYRRGKDYPIFYHRGQSLARDRRCDKALAAVADRMQELADKDWVVISPCGHPRALIKGEGKVRLVQRPGRDGRTIYAAVPC